MAYIPDEIVDEIRSQTDIVDIVKEYVRLEKKGKDYFGLCPFHKEKSPSFSVVPAKQIYYCFGCGKGGNVINFMQAIENLEWPDAVRTLAERARITIPEGDGDEERERARLRARLLEINIAAARFFHQQFVGTDGKAAQEYAAQRGLSVSTIRKFGIGFAPDRWEALAEHLHQQGVSEYEMIQSGLIAKRNKGNLTDRFRNRLIFPIFDVRGQVIAFGGRLLNGEGPKYLNSPDTPVYTKGKHLYGLNFARTSGEKRLLIVEGYMDAVSLHQAGVPCAIASLGTAMTDAQARLVRKHTDEAIIAYDADSAGQNATLRGLDMLGSVGVSVKVLTVPDGKDPDDYIRRHGEMEFRILMEKAEPLVEYKMRRAADELDGTTTQGRIKLIGHLTDVLAKMDNQVERDMYMQKFAREYHVSREAIESEVLKRETGRDIIKVRDLKPKESASSVGAKQSPDQDKSWLLLALLLTENSAVNHVPETMVLPETISQAVQLIRSRREAKRQTGISEILDILVFEDQEREYLVRLIQTSALCDDYSKAVTDVVQRINLQHAEHRKAEILRTLSARDGLSSSDVQQLQQELMTIIKFLKT